MTARRSGVTGWASIFPDLNDRKPKLKNIQYKFAPKNSGQSQIPVLHNLEREFINLRKSRETWNDRVGSDLKRIKFDFESNDPGKPLTPRRGTSFPKPSIMFAKTDEIPEVRRKKRRGRKRGKNLLQSADRTMTPSNPCGWQEEGDVSLKKLNRQSKSSPKGGRRAKSPKSPRAKSPKSPRSKSPRAKSPQLSQEKIRRKSPIMTNRPIATPPYRILQSQGSPSVFD